jgi:hypothetical protein
MEYATRFVQKVWRLKLQRRVEVLPRTPAKVDKKMLEAATLMLQSAFRLRRLR